MAKEIREDIVQIDQGSKVFFMVFIDHRLECVRERRS
jgi:hypothetical protein